MFAQSSQPADPEALRAELLRLVAAGEPERAIALVQQRLRENPRDAGVRGEYIGLHLSLARNWFTNKDFASCDSALDAILAITPDHPEALELRARIEAARREAANAGGQIEQLARLELYEDALERIQEVRQLRPDLGEKWRTIEWRCWRGAADEHFLAGCFREALSIYERIVADEPEMAAAVRSRWAIALAFALVELPASEPLDEAMLARIGARVRDDLPEGTLRDVLRGLLAERRGELLTAGGAYAAAARQRWAPPAPEALGARVAALRATAIERVRALYEAERQQPREGTWNIVLPNAWKERLGAHFHVFARNDLAAQRVVEAAEFHLPRLAEWLGVELPLRWLPRCEIRVYGSLDELRSETEQAGASRAFTRVVLDGDDGPVREVHLHQADPWLLSGTAPHELTRLLIGESYAAVRSEAIVEGLALQTAPPARRLRLRRRMGAGSADPESLLRRYAMPDDADDASVVAQCDALVNWLLYRLAAQQAAATTSQPVSAPTPVVRLLGVFSGGAASDWWRGFGWQSEREMLADWAEWRTGWRDVPRMPLVIRGGEGG